MSYSIEQKIIMSIAALGATVGLFGSVYAMGWLNATRAANRSSVPSIIQPSSNKEIRLTTLNHNTSLLFKIV